MIEASADIKKIERNFVPKDLVVNNWESIEPYFKELLERKITSSQQLKKWLADMSELEAVISEDACWRQIKMTCDTRIKNWKNPSIISAWKFSQRFNLMLMH